MNYKLKLITKFTNGIIWEQWHFVITESQSEAWQDCILTIQSFIIWPLKCWYSFQDILAHFLIKKVWFPKLDRILIAFNTACRNCDNLFYFVWSRNKKPSFKFCISVKFWLRFAPVDIFYPHLVVWTNVLRVGVIL